MIVFLVEQMNLIDPKSVMVDGKIEMLDQIFSQCNYSFNDIYFCHN